MCACNRNILVISPEFGYGGVGINTLKIVNFLLGQGFRVHVHTTAKSKKITKLFNANLQIKRVTKTIFGFDKFSPFLDLLSSIHVRQEKPSLIIRTLPLFYLHIPYISNVKIPELVIVHDTFADLIGVNYSQGDKEFKVKLLSSWLGTALLRSEKAILQKAKKIVAVSEYTKKKLIVCYGISEEKIHVIYNPIDTGLFKRRMPEEIKSEIGKKIKIFKNKSLLAVSVLRPEIVKNPRLLFDLITDLHRNSALSLKFVIVGVNTNIKHIRNYVERAKSSDLLFLGHVDNNILPDIYSLADFLVITSVSENLPTILPEAMACGTIPISTNVGGIPEVIKDRENGFLVYSKKKEEFTEVFHKLANNGYKLNIISKNAEKIAREKFDSEIIKKKYLAVLTNIAPPNC
jgi:glycosyltransferase involved in cell wall biosynthesis